MQPKKEGELRAVHRGRSPENTPQSKFLNHGSAAKVSECARACPSEIVQPDHALHSPWPFAFAHESFKSGPGKTHAHRPHDYPANLACRSGGEISAAQGQNHHHEAGAQRSEITVALPKPSTTQG